VKAEYIPFYALFSFYLQHTIFYNVKAESLEVHIVAVMVEMEGMEEAVEEAVEAMVFFASFIMSRRSRWRYTSWRSRWRWRGCRSRWRRRWSFFADVFHVLLGLPHPS
jgi:hypothetical protein